MENVQMKFTEFFDGNKFTPYRKGVYQVKTDDPNGAFFGYQYWTGKHWRLYNTTAIGAYRDRNYISLHQNFDWQGIKK